MVPQPFPPYDIVAEALLEACASLEGCLESPESLPTRLYRAILGHYNALCEIHHELEHNPDEAVREYRNEHLLQTLDDLEEND